MGVTGVPRFARLDALRPVAAPASRRQRSCIVQPASRKAHPPDGRGVGVQLQTPRGCEMKQRYESPRLVVYGRIADNTFQTPGGMKGCTTDCKIDNFGEQSANSTGS